MNDKQKAHLEYGRKILPGRGEADEHYTQTGGHEDKYFGKWLVENALDIDPLTGKKVLAQVKSACLWAARDTERFERYVRKYPRTDTVRGLHDRYRAEQNGEDMDPSVYVYRMRGPLSGDLLEPQICKIGCADIGAAARVAAQSKKAAVGYFPDVELELKCQQPAALEKLLHEKFKDRQVAVPGREWFEVSTEQVDKAVQELEYDGKLWRDGEWVHVGRKPGPPAKKRRKWSTKKTAALLIYKKVLPNLETMTDDPSCLHALFEQTGLEPDEARAGLQWLVEKGYLDKWNDGRLTPSTKFYKRWAGKHSGEAGE